MSIELHGTNNSDYLKMRRRTLTGDAKWKDIEDLINRWAKRNPQAALDLERYVRQVGEGLYDKKHGANKGSALGRLGLAIDQTLLEYIKAFYPDFMDTKAEMHEFMKRFPKFRIPEQA